MPPEENTILLNMWFLCFWKTKLPCKHVKNVAGVNSGERLPSPSTAEGTVPGITEQNKQELGEYLCGFELSDYARVWSPLLFPEFHCHFVSSCWKPAGRQEYFKGSQWWRQQESQQLRTWLKTRSPFPSTIYDQLCHQMPVKEQKQFVRMFSLLRLHIRFS